MSDGSKVVPCTVSGAALWQATKGAFQDPLSAFASVRQMIEAAASAKYDAGKVDADGGVTLGPRDLLGTP